jgi:hypothetical protein
MATHSKFTDAIPVDDAAIWSLTSMSKAVTTKAYSVGLVQASNVSDEAFCFAHDWFAEDLETTAKFREFASKLAADYLP